MLVPPCPVLSCPARAAPCSGRVLFVPSPGMFHRTLVMSCTLRWWPLASARAQHTDKSPTSEWPAQICDRERALKLATAHVHGTLSDGPGPVAACVRNLCPTSKGQTGCKSARFFVRPNSIKAGIVMAAIQWLPSQNKYIRFLLRYATESYLMATL